MNTVPRVGYARLRDWIASAFETVGIPAADAQIIGSLMAEADLQGSDGHGVTRVPNYVKRIKGGAVNVKPNIRIVRERAGTALLNGDNGMGHLVMKRAAEIAIEKARVTGIAWVGSQWSNHAGPASLYAKMPMAAGMIGLYYAVANANHMPPWGGLDMLLSTNPIAAAIPAGEEPPIVLDMATTVASYGKVKTYAQRGMTMPVGWMVDFEGKPLTDPKRANDGFLLPIGDYKGYGLSLVVGLLAGTLNGAAMGKDIIDFNADSTTPTNTGQAVVAIDIEAFGDAREFGRAVDTLVRDFRGSRRMPGVERIWLPGEQSHTKRRDNEKNGIPIPPGLAASLAQAAKELGIAPLV